MIPSSLTKNIFKLTKKNRKYVQICLEPVTPVSKPEQKFEPDRNTNKMRRKTQMGQVLAVYNTQYSSF